MKYNVLVAEDEMPLLRSICRTIEDCSEDYKVVARVTDGDQAIKQLAEQKIDLAFLDINMPVKSGLDVLKYIHQNCPQTVSVILSGYQEFEFAQKAIQYGAVDFLLKPLKAAEMSTVLNKVSQKIYRQNEEKLRKLLQTSQPGIEQLLAELNVPAHIAVVYFGSYHMQQSEMPLTEDTYNNEKKIRLLLDDVYGSYNYIMVSTYRYAAQLLMVLDKRNTPWNEFKEKFSAANFMSQPITVVADESFSDPDQIIGMYNILRKKAHKIMLYEKSLFYINNSEETDPLVNLSDMKVFSSAIYNLHSYNDLMNQYSHAIYSQDAPTRNQILMVTKKFFETISNQSDCIASYFDFEDDILRIVEQTSDRKQLIKETQQLLVGSTIQVKQRVNEKIKMANEVRNYLDSNISNNVTLVSIEKEFGYVGAYIRNVFRSQFNVSPLDYLLNIRIDRAKMLLNEGEHVKDVALAVGFSDPLYFSKVFKKKTGQSPTFFLKS